MGAPIVISVKIIDLEGKRGSQPFYFDPDVTDTLAKAQAAFEAYAALLYGSGMPSGAGVYAADVTFPLDMTALVLAHPSIVTPTVARLDSGATLSYRNANTKAYSMYVPAVNTSFIADELVTNTGNMLAFNNAMIAGIAGNNPTDPNNLDIIAYRGGQQTTRKL